MENPSTATEAPEIAPQAVQVRKERHCPECNGVYSIGARGTKRFCSTKCQGAFNNRAAAEGKVVIALAKAWRLKRGGKGIGQEALAELCTILDHFNAQDRAAGRPPITGYVEQLLANGSRYIDRARR